MSHMSNTCGCCISTISVLIFVEVHVKLFGLLGNSWFVGITFSEPLSNAFENYLVCIKSSNCSIHYVSIWMLVNFTSRDIQFVVLSWIILQNFKIFVCATGKLKKKRVSLPSMHSNNLLSAFWLIKDVF